MALPESGDISFRDINIELGYDYNYQLALGSTVVRTLFGIESGAIDMNSGHGKANRITRNIVLSSTRDTFNLKPSGVSGYIAGKTDITLTISTGVYLYSVLTSQAALIIEAFAAGDTVSIVNNGFIMGMGGRGGGFNITPGAGGNAINLSYPVSITNNSYIAGGGGGGARGSGTAYSGEGGGGAGGGQSGTSLGGAPGQPGGAIGSSYSGGRILPGSSANQAGGQGGSSENASFETEVSGGLGGTTNNPGQNGISDFGCVSGAGGGGWGAAGGSSGGAGGKAINLNGNTVTWVAAGTRYGAIS